MSGGAVIEALKRRRQGDRPCLRSTSQKSLLLLLVLLHFILLGRAGCGGSRLGFFLLHFFLLRRRAGGGLGGGGCGVRSGVCRQGDGASGEQQGGQELAHGCLFRFWGLTATQTRP